MIINITDNGDEKIVAVEGRIDTVTAPDLEAKLNEIYDSTKKLELDFTGVEYISSAGLRVLLGAQKVMNKIGSMAVSNVNSSVMEVFEITGFSDILSFI